MITTQKQLRMIITEELTRRRPQTRRLDISKSHRIIEKMFDPIMNRIGQVALTQGVDLESMPAHAKTKLETAILNALREAVPQAIA